jgi:hypothetical protein
MGMNKAGELTAGANIIGSFSCQGEVAQKVMDNAANKDPQPPWLADAPAAKGHPNGNDFMDLSDALIAAGLKSKSEKTKGGLIEGSHAM